MSRRIPRLFLSYAREDRVAARNLRDSLRDMGVEVWFDEDSLIAGQDWRRTLTRAIQKADFFVPLLSDVSVGKRGVVQQEFREALEVAKTVPRDQIYVIPVRLNECDPPFEEMRSVQRVDIFEDWDQGVQEIVRAIEYTVGESLADLSGTPTPFEQVPSEVLVQESPATGERTRVTEILHKVVGDFSDYAKSRNVVFKLRDKSAGATVPIDHSAFSRVLYNLLHNAVKYSYTPKATPGWVSVEAEASGKEIEISVESFGSPIGRDEIESGRIFERGYRARSSVGVPGTGLGLFIARQIAKDAQADITVTSVPARQTLTTDGEPTSVPFITTFKLVFPEKGMIRDEEST